jgi:hypothetical protein
MTPTSSKTFPKRQEETLKAATKAGSKKRVATWPQGSGEASGAAAGPQPSQPQHGKEIKLPARYR